MANDADLRLRRPSDPHPPPAAVTKTAAVTFRSSKLPRPGTILTCEYKGQTINVTVRDNGFEYLGQVYRSSRNWIAWPRSALSPTLMPVTPPALSR